MKPITFAVRCPFCHTLVEHPTPDDCRAWWDAHVPWCDPERFQREFQTLTPEDANVGKNFDPTTLDFNPTLSKEENVRRLYRKALNEIYDDAERSIEGVVNNEKEEPL